MRKISPAVLLDSLNLVYGAAGPVHAVFDTNAQGELLEVAFQLADDGTFSLTHSPRGTVYAWVVEATSHAECVRESVDWLVRQCHGAAQHWWSNPKTGEDIRTNPMCFDQKLILIVSEIAEAMEGNRKSLKDDKLPHRPMREVELADALIRICDTAGGFGMDLAGAVVEKMAFNAVRPDHKTENRIAEGGKAY